MGAAEETRTVGSGLWKPVEPQPSKLETQIGGVVGLGCWLVGEDAGLDVIALEMRRGPVMGGKREKGRKEEEEGDGEQKRGGIRRVVVEVCWCGCLCSSFGGWWCCFVCLIFRSGPITQLTLNNAREERSVHPLLRIGGRC